MPTHIAIYQNASCRQGTESLSHVEYGIVAIWFISYVLALGVAIASPLASEMFELAAQY
jgi:hypothetical protein